MGPKILEMVGGKNEIGTKDFCFPEKVPISVSPWSGGADEALRHTSNLGTRMEL